ncbi:MAG: single-stranded-DNA-specific exonuclease RecJ [Clostridium sp.]
MSIKKWVVSPIDKERASQIAERWGIPFFLAMMLDIRGLVEEKKISDYFLETHQIMDPFSLIDMEKAVNRIRQAIDRYEKICVYGDYDADGVTSTTILYSYLESCAANVIYYIPKRMTEGYGLNRGAVECLKEQGVSLIVTVDNGIASVSEVEYANQLGMQVVITDHHKPQAELPPAVAVVDPHRQDCTSTFKNYAGVGVAFQLISALEGKEGDQENLFDHYAELVAIGTIGDIVPLEGDNRILVKQGLSHLTHTDQVGLRALLEEAGFLGKDLSAGNVAYSIVPRINALGRMGSSEQAVRLLLSDDPEEADLLAEKMGEQNQERQTQEGEILQQVFACLDKNPSWKAQHVIVVAGEGWHEGIIGIVASRVVERYGKPCVILTIQGEEAKGSGRSVEGFSLYDAIYSCRDRLTRFGGHPMAAGLTLSAGEIPAFREEINQYAADLSGEMPSPVLHIDCKLNPAALSVNLISQMSAMEPFGVGNPAPLFGLYHMKLIRITPVGGGKHLRLTLERGNHQITAMRFRTMLEEFPYQIGDIVDLAVTLEESEFRGERNLSIFIREIRLSDFDAETYLRQKRWYEATQRGENLPDMVLEQLIPNRQEFAVIYRFLRAHGGWNYGLDVLCSRIPEEKIGCGKLCVILSIMDELNLIRFYLDGDQCEVSLLEVSKKVDLNSSRILSGLRKQRCGEQYA